MIHAAFEDDGAFPRLPFARATKRRDHQPRLDAKSVRPPARRRATHERACSLSWTLVETNPARRGLSRSFFGPRCRALCVFSAASASLGPATDEPNSRFFRHTQRTAHTVVQHGSTPGQLAAQGPPDTTFSALTRTRRRARLLRLFLGYYRLASLASAGENAVNWAFPSSWKGNFHLPGHPLLWFTLNSWACCYLGHPRPSPSSVFHSSPALARRPPVVPPTRNAQQNRARLVPKTLSPLT